MENGFLNVREASQYLGVKPPSLYAMVEKKEIPHYRIGRLIKFKKVDLDAFMQEHRVDCIDIDRETRRVFKQHEARGQCRIFTRSGRSNWYQMCFPLSGSLRSQKDARMVAQAMRQEYPACPNARQDHGRPGHSRRISGASHTRTISPPLQRPLLARGDIASASSIVHSSHSFCPTTA